MKCRIARKGCQKASNNLFKEKPPAQSMVYKQVLDVALGCRIHLQFLAQGDGLFSLSFSQKNLWGLKGLSAPG